MSKLTESEHIRKMLELLQSNSTNLLESNSKKILTEGWNDPYTIEILQYSDQASIRCNFQDIKHPAEDTAREYYYAMRMEYNDKVTDPAKLKELNNFIFDNYHDMSSAASDALKAKYNEELNKIAHVFYVLLQAKLQEFIVDNEKDAKEQIAIMKQKIKNKFGI